MSDLQDQPILYLAAARFPTDKAYGFQIIKVCESMASLGMDALLIFPALAPRQAKNMGVPQFPDLFDFYPIKSKFTARAVSVSPFWDLFYADDFSLWHIVKILLFAIQSRKWIKEFRHQDRVIIWTRDLPVILMHLISGLDPDIRYIFECHDLPKRIIRLFSRWIVNLPGAIVTTSGLKKELMKIGLSENRILVLPNAVDLHDYSVPESQEACRELLGLPKHRPIIGYIGKFQTYGKEKGLPTLLRSIPFLDWRAAYPPLILLVGGPMESAKTYFQMIDDLDLPRDLIRIIDFQPRSDIPKWIKACNVCVIPFPRKGHFTEFACPLKLFEYLAVGVPVVASDLPAIRDVVQDGENGVLVEPDNPAALAQGIQRILNDPEFGAKLAKNGFSTIKENTWENRTTAAISFILRQSA